MLERLFSSAVAVTDIFGDVPEAHMYSSEAALVSKAVAARRLEFGTVRHCARQALMERGFPAAAILPGPEREPVWPPGAVGSLTHCPGYRAAAVARQADVRSLGIDAEPHAPLPSGVLESIALGEELLRIQHLDRDHRGIHWDRIMFSAKETVYKVWYPLSQERLTFDDASIVVRPDGTFSAELINRSTTRVLHGKWLVDRHFICTAIELPASPPQRRPRC
jgi:4'-phosphopantetheinyl transferase EntD